MMTSLVKSKGLRSCNSHPYEYWYNSMSLFSSTRSGLHRKLTYITRGLSQRHTQRHNIGNNVVNTVLVVWEERGTHFCWSSKALCNTCFGVCWFHPALFVSVITLRRIWFSTRLNLTTTKKVLKFHLYPLRASLYQTNPLSIRQMMLWLYYWCIWRGVSNTRF